jgi:UDP-glucose 4-epimerase
MRILVTGGAGFIGSHVVDTFVAAGHHVAVVDNLSTGKRDNLNAAATFYEVDLRDTDALHNVFNAEQPDLVDHHAAQVEVRRSLADPQFDATVNVLGTLNLLEAARAAGTHRIIFISSGGAAYGEPVNLPCTEEHPIRPLSPYGASKGSVELYLSVYAQTHGIAAVILRYANVYGPRQDPLGEAGVVAIFTGKMLQVNAPEDPPVIFGDGYQERDFVYVGDCAAANLTAATILANRVDADHGLPEAYNIGTGVGTSVNELAAHLQDLTDYAGPIVHGEEIAGEVKRIYLAIDKAKADMNWEPQVGLREGLRHTVRYFKS